MPEIRRIELPEKDRPLRADVSLLGSLVGDMLAEQHGAALLETVEAVRKAAIRRREGASDDGFEHLLEDLDHDQVMRVIQAFASYLRAANLAEKVHRLRRRRVYQRAQVGAQRGSLGGVYQSGINASDDE